MQYFNRSNEEVSYIKDLLRSEYVPTVKMFNTLTNINPDSEGKVYTKDKFYLEDCYDGETFILNKTIQKRVGNAIPGEDLSTSIDSTTVPAPSKYLGRYEFGKFYPNITTNFISNKNYYDSDLHEHLGNYLRAYRDYYGIDVMNFYNCFSNRFITSYGFPIPAKPSRESRLPTYDSDYKVTVFPIRFDTTYTVRFVGSSVTNVSYQAVYFNGESPLGAVELDENTNPITYSPAPGTTFTFKIDSENANGLIEQTSVAISKTHSTENDTTVSNERRRIALSRQSLLYVFMRYPADVNSPIIVLEQPKFTSALNNELETVSRSNAQIAFSDTLLEYLTGSVISPATEIGPNVKRIQDKLLQENFLKKYRVGGPGLAGVSSDYHFTAGVFDSGMHRLIYRAFFRVGTPKSIAITNTEGSAATKVEGSTTTPSSYVVYPFGQNPIPNFLGFVDKNVEELIMAVPDDADTVR